MQCETARWSGSRIGPGDGGSSKNPQEGGGERFHSSNVTCSHSTACNGELVSVPEVLCGVIGGGQRRVVSCTAATACPSAAERRMMMWARWPAHCAPLTLAQTGSSSSSSAWRGRASRVAAGGPAVVARSRLVVLASPHLAASSLSPKCPSSVHPPLRTLQQHPHPHPLSTTTTTSISHSLSHESSISRTA